MNDPARITFPPFSCECGLPHVTPDIDIYVGSGILPRLASSLQKRLPGSHLLLVADNHTFEVAGKQVMKHLEENGYRVSPCVLVREGELNPDHVGLGEIMMAMEKEMDFFLAVGSGTLCDLTRYAAACACKPYAIFGTAPSMDGYTSVHAPLLIAGMKTSKVTDPPQVIFCELDIMRKAPPDMFTSGLGDVLGKYIARADWTLSHYLLGEPCCTASLDMVMQAVDKCLANLDGIRNRTLEGTRNLTEALLLSGVTILITSNTRAVASTEHNMSHIWEMTKLFDGETPPAHGIAVGFGTLWCLRFWEALMAVDFTAWSSNAGIQRKTAPTREQKAQAMEEGLGIRVARILQKKNPDFYTDPAVATARALKFLSLRETLAKSLKFLPSSSRIASVWKSLGGPVTAEELRITPAQLKGCLLFAKDFRLRYNCFNLAEDMGILESLVEQVLSQ